MDVSCFFRSLLLFLSTPSARRATVQIHRNEVARIISIHALREEGDFLICQPKNNPSSISIHALREEGDVYCSDCFARMKHISIHALREEGDSKNRDKISIFL